MESELQEKEKKLKQLKRKLNEIPRHDQDAQEPIREQIKKIKQESEKLSKFFKKALLITFIFIVAGGIISFLYSTGYLEHLYHSYFQISDEDKPPFTEPLTGMEFVWIRGDCYDMGCDKAHCEDWEKPVHQVCVKGFWMGKQEVTQGQWKKVMKDEHTIIKDDDPMHNVSWDDAARFISKLNEPTEKTGKTYRLPREAEWEYACKKGVGIDNMKSGVREWCADIFGSYTGNQDNNSRFKVVRGGNYRPKESVRCSYRIGKLSDVQKDDIGFRLVSNESD